MNVKYSDMAEKKCLAETSVSANFTYIFPSDCSSGSALSNTSLPTVDLRCLSLQIGSFVGCEEVRSPVPSSRSQPCPHQGSSKCPVSTSSHCILLCAVCHRKLLSCTFREDFQQASGTMTSQPAAQKHQPSLVLGSPASVPPPFLHFLLCTRA